MTTTTDSLFDEVISAWDEPLRCQTDQTSRPCRNPAIWLAVMHQPCGNSLLCTFHLNRWLRWAPEALVEFGWFGCMECPRIFIDIDEFARFERL
jgi:hypothetical protein